MSYVSEEPKRAMIMRQIIATLRYYSDHHALKFFLALLLIVVYSCCMPFLVEDGCLSKYDEFSPSLKLFGKFGYSSKL